FCGREVRLVGLGGALKALAQLNRPQASPSQRREISCLRLDDIRQRVEWLWSLSSVDRRKLDGLDPEKTDVILSGAVIYEAVMTKFNFSELFVSQRGLRDGALMSSAKPPAAVQTPDASLPSLPDAPLAPLVHGWGLGALNRRARVWPL